MGVVGGLAAGHYTAIDRQHRAGDPGCVIRGEEEQGSDDIARLTIAPQRMEVVECG